MAKAIYKLMFVVIMMVFIFMPSIANAGLAGGKTVTADSEEGTHVAVLAVDGNSNTYWSGTTVNSGWLAVDLGEVKTINSFSIATINLGAIKDYQLESSPNGIDNWTVLKSVVGNQWSNRNTNLDNPVDIRYIRLNITNGWGNPPRILTFDVFAPEATASGNTNTPTAGSANAITLRVINSDGVPDTTFNGAQNVLISGVVKAPDNSYGSFNGTNLDSNSEVNGQAIPVTFTNGVATANLILNKAATQNITFKIDNNGTYKQANTLSFAVAMGNMSRMVLSTDITAPAANGGQFAQQPVIALTDTYGNIFTNDNATQVTVTKKDAGTWTLTGTTTKTASSGVVAFTDLGATNAVQVDNAQLAFNSGALTEVTGTTVTLPPPPPAPHATVSAEAASNGPVVGADNTVTLTVKYSSGDTDTSFNGDKTVTITGYEAAPDQSYGSFGGIVLEADGSTNITLAFTNGVATANLKLNKAAAQTISFSISGVDTPATNNLSITPAAGAVSGMTITTNITAPALNGGQFAQQPVITLKDTFGNICTNDSTTVVIATKQDAGTWTLSGTTVKTASSGVVTFTDLVATNAVQVNNAQISFGSGDLTPVTSDLVVLPLPVPSAQPANLYFSSKADNKIILNFTQSASAAYYLIVRKIGSAPSFVPINGIAYTTGTQGADEILSVGTAATYTESGITFEQDYYYKIYAFNGSGTGTRYLTTTPLSGKTRMNSGTSNVSSTLGNSSSSEAAGFPEAGVTVTFPNGTTGTNLNVTKTNALAPFNFYGNYTSGRTAKNLYFNITSSNSSPGTYTIIIDFSSLGLTQQAWESFIVLKRADSAGGWKDITTLGGVIVNRQTDGVWGKFTITGLSSFSEFTGCEPATVYTVTSASDSGANSLRALIDSAVSGDIIEFNTNAMGGNRITLASTIVINKDITIRGTSNGIILDGNHSSRVLTADAGKVVRLENIMIQNGNDTENIAGGIYNVGTLYIVNCVVSGNIATGVVNDLGGVGGILQDGVTSKIFIINSTIAGNEGASTDYGVGGIVASGTAEIYNSIFYGNTGQYNNAYLDMTVESKSYNSLYGDPNGDVKLNSGSGNLFQTDPKFVGSGTNPYKIFGNSPCVDTGNNNYSDLDYDIRGTGYARKLDKTNGTSGTIDMGAYEYKFSVDPEAGAHTATASANTNTPLAGADNAITLTVKDSIGSTDVNVNGARNVTISGVAAAPNTTYGSFNGTLLTSDSVTNGQVISVVFTNGAASANLSLNKAAEQTIAFSIASVTTPATNSISITATAGTAASMTVSTNITAPLSNGGQFAQQPVITLKDSYGNTCTGNNSTQVTASRKDSGTWTLTGTATRTASGGIVNFTDLGASNILELSNAQLAFNTTGLSEVTSTTVTLPAMPRLATIAADQAMTEANLDARSLTVTLSGDSFADNSLDKNNFTLNNAPSGASIEGVSYTDSIHCTVNLAFDGTDFDADINNLTLTIGAAELTIGQALTSNQLTITATNDAETSAIADDGNITEGAENGEIITVTLTGGTFASTLTADNWTITNLPTGVSKGAVTRINATTVTIALSGNSTQDYDSNITSVTVSCTTAEYNHSTGGDSLSANTGVTLRAVLHAQTATASVASNSPVSGENNTITFTVKDSLGNTDIGFSGAKNITISGVTAAPNGTFGSFNGTVLDASSAGMGQTISLTFTNGFATANITLNKAGAQTIAFSIATVVTPATNTLSITPAAGTAASMTVSTNITAPLSNGGQFAQQPVIILKDSFENTCIGDSSTQVTVSKKDTGTWSLTGTAVVTASNGTATFTELGATNTAQVNNAQLAFNAGSMTEITSAQVTLPAPDAPSAPNIQSAVAGDAHVVITWNSVIGATEYEVYQSMVSGTYGTPLTIVSSSVYSYDATELVNGTTYYFVVKAANGGGDSGYSNEVSAMPKTVPAAPTTPTTPTEPTKPSETGVEILVNGKKETAATATTTKVDDKIVTTVTIDDKKVEEKLQIEGNNTVVTIPVKNEADVVVGQLNGQTIKNMETKEAVLEIITENVTYTLPASQINIDNVSSEIGEQVDLKDISVNITISAPPQDTVKIIEDTANKNNYQVVVKPVDFEITCTSGNKTVEVSKFNGYVERTVAIPDGIDPSKITTGIVLNNDGTFSHVPTTIIIIDGKYYAKINSLTNSTYTVIWSPKTYMDVENHWAKDDINEMGSRLVIDGVGYGKFEPDRDITRAECAAIIVKALGLMRSGSGNDAFMDVAEDAWYYDAVSIAFEYGIISGYGNGKFGPMNKITREQAMSMIERAMIITGLKVEFKEGEAETLLAAFRDSGQSSAWAKESTAACIKAGIVSGKSGKMLQPKDEITRAEVAAIVRRLLQKSKLI